MPYNTDINKNLLFLSTEEVYQMARFISDDCVSCGSCADVCPVGAISQGSDKYEIDESVCVDCGVCEEGCPVSAIAEAE